MISFVHIYKVTLKEIYLLKFHIFRKYEPQKQPNVKKNLSLGSNIVDDRSAYSRKCLPTYQGFCYVAKLSWFLA
jgi:hypothetical protein